MRDVDFTPDAYFAIEITKVADQPDGSVMVYGCPANPEQLDNDDQIADQKWLEKALPDWFHSYGNVREMHQPSAVGSAKTLDWKSGKPQLSAKIVDPVAVKKVREDVYKAFSVGVKKPETRFDPKARGGRIVGGKIVEVSLVDRPSIPGSDIESFKAAVASGFMLCKAVGANEWLDTQSGAVIAETVPTTGGEMAEKSADASVWDTSGSEEQTKAKIAQCLNGPVPGVNPRFWVMDLADDRALVQDWQAGEMNTAWIVPFTRAADGSVETAPSSEWVKAKQEWVEAQKAMRAENRSRGDDTMAAEKTAGADAEKAGKPVGLTGKIKASFAADLKDASRNPTTKIAAGMRRLSQWAASGNLPTGLSYADVKWMYDQSAAELKRRDPKSEAGGNLPALGSGKAADADEDDTVEKCQALTDALGSAASDSSGEDTRKAAAVADDAKGVEAPIEKEAVVDSETKAAAAPGADPDGDGDAAGDTDNDGDGAKAAEAEAGSALKMLEKALADKCFCAACGEMKTIEGGVEKTVGSQRMLVGKDAAGHELHKYIGPAEKAADAEDGKAADAEKADEAEKGADAEKGDDVEHGDGDGAKKPFDGAAPPFKADDDDGKNADADTGKTDEAVAKLATLAGGDAAFKAALGEVLADTLGIDLGKVGRKMAAKRLERLSKALDEMKAIAAELGDAEIPDDGKAADVGGPTATDGQTQLGVTRLFDAVNVVNQLCREIKAAADGEFATAGHDGADPAMGTAGPLKVKERIDENQGKNITADLTKAVTEEMTKVVGPELAKSVAAHVEEAFAPLVRRLEQVEHTVTPARPPILVEADRKHALDTSDAQKAASAEVLRADLEKRLAGLSDKEREEILASVVANTRGWR